MDKTQASPFSFLEPQLAKETHILEVLNEILRKQNEYLMTHEGGLVTLAELLKSRNIKIPHSVTRNKNIIYFTDLLCKKYPNTVRAMPSFSFTASKEAKKLHIDETVEFSVDLDDDTFTGMKRERDSQTMKNILELLSMLKSANLSKLLKNLTYRNYLINLLQNENGGNLFFYRQYSFHNNDEISEIFCFHKKNFGQLKSSLSVDEIKKIMSKQPTSVLRKLNSFGIMNINFSDYTDTKLDYIIRALLDEVSNQPDKRDMLTVKNFAALREGLLKAGQNVNPLVSMSSNITAHIKEQTVCSAGELTAVFPPLTAENLSQWPQDDLDKKKILIYNGENSVFFIDPFGLVQKLESFNKIMIEKPETFAAISGAEKKKNLELLEILYNCGLEFEASGKTLAFLGSEAGAQRLHQLLKNFEEYKNAPKVPAESHTFYEREEHKSIIKRLLDLILSLFTGNSSDKKGGKSNTQSDGKSSAQTQKPLSKLAKDIVSKIEMKNAPLIPLSDYIELNRENEKQIGPLIDEIRQHNLKLVIPVYNARTLLYPMKSSGYIMSDIEYLLVDPSVTLSSESITEFTDSLARYKLKGETIQGKAIVVIENYLLTLYRQKRVKKGKKG